MPTTIKERLQERLREIHANFDTTIGLVDDDILKAMREEIDAESREKWRKVEAEFQAKQARIEAEFSKKQQAAEEEAAQLAAALPATQTDRRAFIDFAYDLEADAMVRAAAAGFLLDEERIAFEKEKTIRQAVFYSLLVLFVPLVGVLGAVLHWAPDSFRLWAVVLSHVVAFIAIGVSNDKCYTEHTNFVRYYEKMRSSFNALGMSAQKAYKVDGMGNHPQLWFKERVSFLNRDRDVLKEFCPLPQLLERANTSLVEVLTARIKPILDGSV